LRSGVKVVFHLDDCFIRVHDAKINNGVHFNGNIVTGDYILRRDVMVTVLRLILSILSTPGMMKKIPGPFAPINLPNRKITPLSYSLRILMAAAARIIIKIIKRKDLVIIRYAHFPPPYSIFFTLSLIG